VSWTIKTTSEKLAREVQELTGTDIRTCYQCGKCSAGCPVATHSDMGPRQIMHSVQIGEREQVLRCSGIWLCVGCEACSTRCPREVGPSHVIDALRQIALKEGYNEEVPPTVETIPIFHDAFMTSIRVGGRVWELFLVGYYKMRSLDLFSDTLLGAQMFFKGKLSVLPPHRVSAASKILKKIDALRAKEREELEEREKKSEDEEAVAP